MTATPQRLKILLLGASGKLGRMLQSVWASDGDQDIEIIPVFRTQRGAETGLIWGPGSDPQDLPKVNAIAAFWGVTGDNRLALEANITLAEHAIVLGERLGAGCVLHCSSQAVYEAGEAPLTEAAICAPASSYGAAKLAMERAVQRARTPIAQHILRIGNVAGADSLFANLRPGDEVTIDRFADGTGPARSYIGPGDLARVVTTLSRHTMSLGPVNVAAPIATYMDEIARAAGASIIWKTAPETALPRVMLETTRLQALCPLSADAGNAARLVEDARATGVWP